MRYLGNGAAGAMLIASVVIGFGSGCNSTRPVQKPATWSNPAPIAPANVSPMAGSAGLKPNTSMPGPATATYTSPQAAPVLASSATQFGKTPPIQPPAPPGLITQTSAAPNTPIASTAPPIPQPPTFAIPPPPAPVSTSNFPPPAPSPTTIMPGNNVSYSQPGPVGPMPTLPTMSGAESIVPPTMPSFN